MKEIAAVTFLILSWLPSMAIAQSDPFVGREMLKNCEQDLVFVSTPDGQRSGGNIRQAATCVGFVVGLVEGIYFGEYWATQGKKPVMCIPDGVNVEQYVRVAVKWLRNNPERLHERASVLVASAFVQAWPCN